MHEFIIQSPSAQLTEYLRREIPRGTWGGEMPGTPRLAEELGIDRRIITAALNQLEEEGLLVGQGVGKPRKIRPSENPVPQSLKVAILKQNILHTSPILSNLPLRIEAAGFGVFDTDKSLLDLKMDPKRIADYVKRNRADAWIVVSASREVLEWFAHQPFPVFALFGQYADLPVAATGPDISHAITDGTRRLIETGHRRISMLVRKHHRQPMRSHTVDHFLDELNANGITPGPFNLPSWDESTDGLHTVLDSLFRLTPPTALIPNESFLFNAVYHYLAAHRLRVPQDVSLICTEADPNHAWCRPSVAHIHWDYRPALRRILRWVTNIACGKDDRKQTPINAEFVEGGTIGPAPSAR